MVKVKTYAKFYASDVRLAPHGSGSLKLYYELYVVGRSTTWNRRDRITGYELVRITSSAEQHCYLLNMILHILKYF